jgi:hypothetical protein
VHVSSPPVLVLLPPSETKALGGDGPPPRLDALSHPELTPARWELIDELMTLAGDVPAGLGECTSISSEGSRPMTST